MNATDPTQPAAPAEPEQSATEIPAGSRLEEAEARAEQFRADWLRAMAELENYRKRAAREIDAARQYGVERFAAELLPVMDSLAAGLQVAASADAATLAAGQQATQRLLAKAFERAGITEIDPAGQPFDPALHEAIATQPSAGQPPHTVLQVIQHGYLLNGRMLRPARVVVSVAAEGPAAPEADG
ncbi:MAG: nucleotide exchange factor GrpE [Gammaproteobacteria bacterium]